MIINFIFNNFGLLLILNIAVGFDEKRRNFAFRQGSQGFLAQAYLNCTLSTKNFV
jgi:hypothetical protein